MPPDEFGSEFPIIRFRRALHALAETDKVRLHLKAEAISRVLGGCFSGSDLLHEAVERTLAGSRRFPDDVNLEAYLVMVMKSIASDEIRKRVHAERVSGDTAVALQNPRPEESVLVDLAALVDEFDSDGDEEAALVIEEWRQGKNGPEIQASLGMDGTTYNSTVRRIRRKARRFLPGGKARKS